MAEVISTQLRKGTVFKFNNKVYLVQDYKHIKKGRSLAIVRLKVRDVESGSTVEKTFTSNEKVESVSLDHKSAQFLYSDNEFSYFMDSSDFNQFQIENKRIEWEKNFLSEGANVRVLWLQDKVVHIEISKKVKLKVKYTEHAVSGDTAISATKKAELETGFELQVPLFIGINDFIIVNSEKGNYVSKG